MAGSSSSLEIYEQNSLLELKQNWNCHNQSSIWSEWKDLLKMYLQRKKNTCIFRNSFLTVTSELLISVLNTWIIGPLFFSRFVSVPQICLLCQCDAHAYTEYFFSQISFCVTTKCLNCRNHNTFGKDAVVGSTTISWKYKQNTNYWYETSSKVVLGPKWQHFY